MGLGVLLAAIEYVEYYGRMEEAMSNNSNSPPSSDSGLSSASDLSLPCLMPPPPEQQEPPPQPQFILPAPPQPPPSITPPTANIWPRFEVPANQGEERGLRGGREEQEEAEEEVGQMMLKRRKLHNALEKHRRANMREQLDALKSILPLSETTLGGLPYGRLMTTSATLRRSVIYIETLQAEERENEKEVERLKGIKRELEEKVKQLTEEITTPQEPELQNSGEDVSPSPTPQPQPALPMLLPSPVPLAPPLPLLPFYPASIPEGGQQVFADLTTINLSGGSAFDYCNNRPLPFAMIPVPPTPPIDNMPQDMRIVGNGNFYKGNGI